MFLLGLDIGTSSIKASLLSIESGDCIASVISPETEMQILTPAKGWAEQDPETWWENTLKAINRVLMQSAARPEAIKAIGISYQMHGLVCLDDQQQVVRNSIIWCDSRAVETGNRALKNLGTEKCLEHLLNWPGNFTASKLAWVKENEPELFSRIHKFMLPGDFIATRLTGDIRTTISGLSEGILWDFISQSPAEMIINHYGFNLSLLADLVPTFGFQGEVSRHAAEVTGLKAGTPVTYRAGDQPNNAFSLNVLNPGEIAATAGTSGVVYGISDKHNFDTLSRVNTFVHVNHTREEPRNGILLCVNGTGILNSWMKKIAGNIHTYPEMNRLAATVSPGADGLRIYPFGNGAERMLGNAETGCSVHNLNFNLHGIAHLFRAAQEGIAFSLQYGIGIMKEMGVQGSVIRAGKANMFLSPVFAQTLADISGAAIELYNTDGSLGAARGAGIGAGIFRDFPEAFSGLKKIETIQPGPHAEAIREAYHDWEQHLPVIKSH